MLQRISIISIVVLILFIGGIWFAFLLPDKEPSSTSSSSNTSSASHPVFSDLRIGTLVRASYAADKNPPIKQKGDYTIKEPLMLRSTTTSGITEPVSVTVRLLDEKTKIVPLSPATVTLEPGTGSYCCWTIPKPGQYTLQIFRPDSLITTLPLKITPDFSTSIPKQ